MLKNQFVCLFTMVLSLISTAQVDNALQTTLDRTNKVQLLHFADSLFRLKSAEKENAMKQAKKKGWKTRMELENGNVAELIRVDENGNPVYYLADNADAAISTNTKSVYPGGSLSLSLEGENMFIGEWDAGAARFTHEQLAGRVFLKDNTPYFDNHSTHVCGTLIGDGVPQSQAKGMAPKSSVWSYDWNSDNAEMAVAAANGMLVSNHSYGIIAGWFNDGNWHWYGNPAINVNESYLFGWYNTDVRAWDNIAYNAPYYLIVKSAGNDRDDAAPPEGTPHTHLGSGVYTDTHPNDGNSGTGYDCLPSQSNAKNILTVAAVGDITGGYNGTTSVSMAYFSGWGPTDDGRIKPDISGNGIGLFSSVATGDDRYASFSGTSMASPNVAGSCILLQEHYEHVHPGNFMHSATLKGLVIHTADEAGVAEGPDYEFGWGLMNTGKAASLISLDTNLESHLQETILNNGSTFSHTITASGTQPLVATICWTDVPGVPEVAGNDIDALKLINDLDLRISNGTDTYFPYILNPSNPSLAASTGDNFRDNVEKIFIPNPAAGEYLITVSHKGNLTGGSQPFSLILSGITNRLCSDPHSIVVRQINSVSSEVIWTAGNSSLAYALEYGLSGFTPGSGTTITGTLPLTAPIIITHLLADTDYDVYIKENCTDTETNRIGPVLFKLIPVISSGACENFDAFNFCGNNLFECVQNGSCNGAFTTPGWENPMSDNTEWSVGDNATPSNNTGPDGDHTSGSGKYLFTEASSCFNQTAMLLTPAFDLSYVNNASLSFWYHMLGSSMGALSVAIENPVGAGTWTELWSISGNQGQTWHNASVHLSGFENNIVRFRFSGTTGPDFESDIAIDDVCVSSTCTGNACNDNNPCTTDTCNNGICANFPLCTDNDECTMDVCAMGNCQHTSIPGCTHCNNTLITNFTGNTAQNGNMFDVTALNTMRILSFDGHFKDSTDFEIYYKSGSHAGYETNPAAWSLLGHTDNTPSNGINTPSPIPITVNIIIPKGETYAFYITATNGKNLRFKLGSFVGNPAAQDANLIVKEGTSSDYPFGTPSQPWIWNGIIHYACSDMNPCSMNSCSNGVCIYTPVSCPDDSIPCTINLGCVNGQCVVLPNLCDDLNPCTTDNCNSFDGCWHDDIADCDLCDYLTCDDHDACTNDECTNEQCTYVPVNCDDNDICTMNSCNVFSGCIYPLVNCSDGNACTDDYCDIVLQCVHATIPCDDFDACTTDDCNASSGCMYLLKNCDDTNACTDDGCSAGVCGHLPVNCNDVNACTIDTCSTLQGCSNILINCSDGNSCTIDHCDNGECMHNFCTDGNLCTTDNCENGVCVYASLACNDGDLCTIDACENGNCIFSPLNCSDSNACTLDRCNDGVCSNTSINCDDSDLCTMDNCTSGLCRHTCDLLPRLSQTNIFGGSSNEEANAIQQTADGGFILAGYTTSTNGDISANHGMEDFWIVKLNAAGNLVWQKTLGGGASDIAYSVLENSDGSFIAAGYTASNNGDIASNHGQRDYWIVKLDATGNLLWQKTYGGTSNDEAHSITSTADGGYITAGFTFSNNGDISGNHGLHDFWIVKLDSSGNLQWQKTFGGTSIDIAASVQEISGSGYIVAGYSLSINGDVSANHGSFDYWVIRLDSSGSLLWQKTFGGTASDKATAIRQTNDRGFIVAGSTTSFNGDISGSHGSLDYWVVKIDATGTLVWQKALGGNQADEATSVIETLDNGYMVTGGTASGNGNVTGNHGGVDSWSVKLSSSGNIEWQKTSGGNLDEKFACVVATPEGSYLLAGYAQSANGDVSLNMGANDFWVARLSSCIPITTVDSLVCPDDYSIPRKIDTLTSHNGCDSILIINLSVTECNDKSACTADVCDDGQCFHTPVNCDDGNPCTVDICNAQAGCLHPSASCVYIISGLIKTETGIPVPGVTVHLTGSQTQIMTTNVTGLYSFTVDAGGTYVITPAKFNDSIANNGVTTFDISLIRRHVLRTAMLVSPYKIIAADANGSGSVSTADIPPMRAVALNNSVKFPPLNSRLWEFVSSAQVFSGPPYNPFPFIKTRTYSNISSDHIAQDFIGVKIGDVNNSWNADVP